MAQFVWPTEGNFSTVAFPNTVNVFDRLEVTYNSTWSNLNLTLSCLASSTGSTWLIWSAAANPILSDGTYAITSIDSLNFNIHQFPTNCKFKLTKYGNSNQATEGDHFAVNSVAGTSTTYKMPSTATDSSTTTKTRTSQDATSATATRTSAAASSAASTSSPSAASGSSSGLSVAAQAGIGVGVGLLVLIIGLLTFFVLRQRRKLRRRERLPDAASTPPSPTIQLEPSRDVKPELPGGTVAASHSMHKHEMDSQQPPAQPPSQQRIELEAPVARQMQSGPHELG